tara:strand:+ start:1500 stop:2114 length:615 start_codon:yes stop_codon:yes gene_type:complete
MLPYDYLFKLLIIGPEFSGKTSFSERVCNNKFSFRYDPTIGVEYSSTVISIFNQLRIKCQFWDTAGKKIFTPIVERYYKGVAGIFIIVDISNPECIKHIQYWINHYMKFKDGDPTVIIVGNKIDKDKKYLSLEQGEAIANNHGFLYSEISCKDDVNVIETNQHMTETIFNNFNPEMDSPGIRLPPIIDLTKKEKNERESCCCIF